MQFWFWHDLNTLNFLGVGEHGDTLTKYPRKVESPGCGKALHLSLFQLWFLPHVRQIQNFFLGVSGHGVTLTKYPRKSKAQDAVKHRLYFYYQYGRGTSSPMPHVIHDRLPIILQITTSVGGRLTTRTKLELVLALSRQFFLPRSTAAHTF